MDSKKLLRVIGIYRTYFEKMGCKKEDVPHDKTPQGFADSKYPSNFHTRKLILKKVALAHCHRMLDQMEQFVAEGHPEKTFRWLGFIQGVLWLSGCYTLEELKNHNHPDTAV